MNRKTAISAIDRAGVLLVFPMDNRKEPASLWSVFFPRSPMRWEWDESGDNRVSDLWHLRGELTSSRKVIYTKWYRGRATYFSRELFTVMLRALNPWGETRESLSETSRKLLGLLEAESPLSTKQLKRLADLKGKANERLYEKSLQELWSRLLIVAYGEVDEGAFPSLAVGSAKVLFEDLWSAAFAMKVADAERKVEELLGKENPFFRHYQKLKTSLPVPAIAPAKEADKKAVERPRVAKVIRFEDL